jgi:DNA-binding LacI/PurR family transcriptional regulator
MRDRLSHHNLVAVAFPLRMSSWASNAIDVDNARVAQLAAELLIRQNRRRWAIVCDGTGSEGLALRQAAFTEFARQAGVSVKTIHMPPKADHRMVRDELVNELQRSNLDGLFAPTLIASDGALLACHQLGVTPGEDLAIIGSDCDRRSSSSMPRVTSVDVSWNEAGQAATRRLLELRQAHEYRFDNILLPPRVTPGDTCLVPEDLPGVERPPIPPLGADTVS